MALPRFSTLQDTLQSFSATLLSSAKKFFWFVAKRDYSSRNLAILFLLAVCSGAGIKAIANDTLTIGFDDYRLASSENTLDLNRFEKESIERKNSGNVPQETPQGKVCAE